MWPAPQEPHAAARDLERDDDALADLEPVHRVPELDDLGDALVAERERPAHREEARGEEEVDVAARDGERPDEGLAVALEPRLGRRPAIRWCSARCR